ncbi:MAG TPA: 16S rRNA (guanine(966)-N(2))-methyltransferase RsmD [Bacillota bacterium]|nr:16S rRNA (guanine(966)-N(2))-methyltransferase RsmD [Bacillota bacterium]
MSGPPSDKTRPTEDRVRQALFNVLGPRLIGARCLDFFAGTGALGIEALSRGAAYSAFIEMDSRVVKVLRSNLALLSIPEDSFRVWTGDALRLAACLEEEGEEFGLIFLDPPYASKLYTPALKMIQERKLLSPNGLVVLEHSIRDNIERSEDNWICQKTKVYGETMLEFWGLAPKEEDGV